MSILKFKIFSTKRKFSHQALFDQWNQTFWSRKKDGEGREERSKLGSGLARGYKCC